MNIQSRPIQIPVDDEEIQGDLNIPEDSTAIVVFAHGSGSSRHSLRNQFVARTLREHGVGTLLFDLLTEAEEQEDRLTGDDIAQFRHVPRGRERFPKA